MSQSQPAASLKEFADLLEQAEGVLGLLDELEAPLRNTRRKLRKQIRRALGLDAEAALAPAPEGETKP